MISNQEHNTREALTGATDLANDEVIMGGAADCS